MNRTFGGLTENEALDVLAMARTPQWASFQKYLEFQEKTAVERGMALNNGLEKSGYYKGIHGLSRDIQSLPAELSVFVNKKTATDRGFVALDGADAP